jgi:transketolase
MTRHPRSAEKDRIGVLEAHARDIRRAIVSMVHTAQSGHCGGSLSATDIVAALESARKRDGKPLCIIARTVKGKGVSFMEDKLEWHGKPPSDAEHAQACAEIEGDRR